MRTILLLVALAVAVVAAGCAGPGEEATERTADQDQGVRSGVNNSTIVDTDQTGCLPSDQVGNGAGDITAGRSCDNVTQTSLP